MKNDGKQMRMLGNKMKADAQEQCWPSGAQENRERNGRMFGFGFDLISLGSTVLSGSEWAMAAHP